MAELDEEWNPLSLDSPLEASPSVIVPAPVIGAAHLPFELLPWEDFERLLWRVLRDVEGLRHARIYGKRGQAQHGLDIVALAPDEAGVALQSKRYEEFKAADLDAAVKKLRETKRPFDVDRFIIGVACEANLTAVVEALATYQSDLHPMKLELWDKELLSAMLRTQPELVIQFFGVPTAQAFCPPFTFHAVEVPSADAVAVREALARTPEESTGAAESFRAAEAETANPARALELIEEGQSHLRQAGFRAHAARREEQRSRVLAQLGRADEAARGALDEVWAALDQGRTINAELSARRLQQIAADVPDDARVRDLAAAAEAAIDLYLNPLGHTPAPDALSHGDPGDHARLALLAGEIALANDRLDWLIQASNLLADLAAWAGTDRVLRTRIRLLIAEASGDWTDVLGDARKLRLGHDLGSLVTARYARYQALRQRFDEADALWEEAAGDASLAQRWTDASTWVLSRRASRTRWRLIARDELLALEIALGEMGPSEPVLPTDDRAYTAALENLRTQRLRPAAISAQRALRQAVASSDWIGEERSRRVLGAILAASDEPELAARHFAHGADTAAMKELAAQFAQTYIGVIESLDAPNYWTVGTAYRLIAAQADLIPDRELSQIANRILNELEGAESGTLPDARSFATSRYNGAVKALAGLADRLTEGQAEAVLAHFERQPFVEPNQYRFHDEDEATAVARIALSHPSQRPRAIAHLVPLLARSQGARSEITMRGIDTAPEIARTHLQQEAETGNTWAQEMLAQQDEAESPPEVSAAALARLTTSLTHHPGVYSVGTNAIGDSALARSQPAQERSRALGELLRRAADPHVSQADRGDYLLAASNLVHGLDQETRRASYDAALALVTDPAPSEKDEFEAEFGHKLSGIRLEPAANNTRAKALYLAACLADEDTQRAEVKQQAYALLGASDRTDYWPTRVLQRLKDALTDDLGFLAGQSWAPRSLAALLWAKHSAPAHLGRRLATDSDPRVRRALATALAATDPSAAQDEARRILREDPAYSVRSILGDE